MIGTNVMFLTKRLFQVNFWNDFQTCQTMNGKEHFDGLVQDCSNSIANALELLQFCTKPSIWYSHSVFHMWLQEKHDLEPLPLRWLCCCCLSTFCPLCHEFSKPVLLGLPLGLGLISY